MDRRFRSQEEWRFRAAWNWTTSQDRPEGKDGTQSGDGRNHQDRRQEGGEIQDRQSCEGCHRAAEGEEVAHRTNSGGDDRNSCAATRFRSEQKVRFTWRLRTYPVQSRRALHRCTKTVHTLFRSIDAR
jgi:hypothetical protein